MIPIEGLFEIVTDYDGMLIDQFGVLHDGARLYPGALDVLAKLHELKVPVAVMTNSGKRTDANVARLTRMGIPREFYVDAVSSGEVAYDVLRGTAAKRAFIIGRTGDEYGFDYFELVDRPADADVILILGTNVPKTSLEDYGRLLSGITVPAICCNPDKLMITPTGLQPAPGRLQHVVRSIDGDHFRDERGERSCDLAGATPEVADDPRGVEQTGQREQVRGASEHILAEPIPLARG